MSISIDRLYYGRFSEAERVRKNEIWKVLCRDFFQKFIPRDSVVLDVGAGFCEFINNIVCSKKYAVDLNSDISKFAHAGVIVFNTASTDLSFTAAGSIDIVFMSNFLEHLMSKEDILKTLLEVFRVLKPSGKAIILQPNIRYLCGEYWDFFDHRIPLSDRSVVEVLQIAGFRIKCVLPKFLPYTTKGKLPHNPFLVKAYLKMPFVWKFLGKQMFILAEKP